MKKSLLAVPFIFTAVSISVVMATAAAALSFWQGGYSYTTVVNDVTLQNPTGLEVAPDGRMFIAERNGTISVVSQPGAARQTVATVLVENAGERGLLNIALDTDFANFSYMYAYYTGKDSKVHIAKAPVSESGVGAFADIFVGSEVFNQYHNGGGLDTDAQGHVYFSMGDNFKSSLSQELTADNGKVMRINRDGSIPADNPYAAHPTAQKAIYASGFRNPFRLSVDRPTGQVYVGDVGGEHAEEINLVQPGKNYGWPDQEGSRCATTPCPFALPLYHYNRGATGLTVMLGPVYRGSSYPASMQGRLFFGDWMVGMIDTIGTAAPHDLKNFTTDNGNIIDFDLAADGKVYFIEHYSHKVTRIDYNGNDIVNHEPTATLQCTPLSATVPVTVNCTAQATDADNDLLAFAWDFGEGPAQHTSAASYTYQTPGAKTITLAVSDGKKTTTATTKVQAGRPPTVVISQPDTSRLYKAGETFTYNVTAQSGTGALLTGTAVSVKINLRHNEHEHDFVPPTPGTSGTVTVPTTGETEPTILYRIYASATDPSGLSTTVTKDVHMKKSQLTLATSIGLGNLTLDGVVHTTGTKVEGVAGLRRTVEAPESITAADGKLYKFSSWSDGGERVHALDFPEANTTLTAAYTLQPGNLVKNASLEDYRHDLSKPNMWRLSRWGDMQSSFNFLGTGRDASKGCGITVTQASEISSSFCHPEPMQVEAGKQYTFSHWRKSTTYSGVFALYTNKAGMYQFEMLSLVFPSEDWAQHTVNFTPPTAAETVTLFTTIHTTGSLASDDYDVRLTEAVDTSKRNPSVFFD